MSDRTFGAPPGPSAQASWPLAHPSAHSAHHRSRHHQWSHSKSDREIEAFRSLPFRATPHTFWAERKRLAAERRSVLCAASACLLSRRLRKTFTAADSHPPLLSPIRSSSVTHGASCNPPRKRHSFADGWAADSAGLIYALAILSWTGCTAQTLRRIAPTTVHAPSWSGCLRPLLNVRPPLSAALEDLPHRL